MECQNNLSFKNPIDVANCDKVVWSACEFGKAPKLPDGAANTNPRKYKHSEIKRRSLLPGQRLSVYHYQLDVTGRIYSSWGEHYNPINIYCGGA